MTSNIEWICGGDKIGSTVEDETSPYYNTVPIHPVMCAQLEAIVYSCLLRSLQRIVRLQLRQLMSSPGNQGWLPAYLSIFILCHSCALTTRRDEQFARRMGFTVRGVLFCHQSIQMLMRPS